jgi:hypothetical protein
MIASYFICGLGRAVVLAAAWRSRDDADLIETRRACLTCEAVVSRALFVSRDIPFVCALYRSDGVVDLGR